MNLAYLQPLHEATIKAVKHFEAQDDHETAKNLLLLFLGHRQAMLAIEKHLKEFEKVWRR